MVQKSKKDTRFIVVAGGVISGVGKGITTASIGKIIKEYGFHTTLIKIDPYFNCDAGTLRPTEHGEVWVTEDGGEIDQDLGTYERFMDIELPKKNNITSGQIYKTIIDRERAGEYLGKTVQFIPHVTDEIVRRIKEAAQGYEVVVIEIGGTVGDYENVPFLCAIKGLEREIGSDFLSYVLVTFLPVPTHIDEMKTKPTQQAIRLLGEQGIMPDFIVCRSEYPIDDIRKKKIAEFGYLKEDRLIAAPNINSIYHMPLEFEQQGFGRKLLQRLYLVPHQKPDWSTWQGSVDHIDHPEHQVKIAIVGKYINSGSFSMTDSYMSICHALTHAGASCKAGVHITWLDAAMFEEDAKKLHLLYEFDGIIIPGGFGDTGVEGKICAITFAREQQIPFIGLCYGLQLAVVEYARNIAGLEGAHTTEVDPHTAHPVIDILPLQKEILRSHRYGGTMRLGAYDAQLKRGTMVHSLYEGAEIDGIKVVYERHRHRYEVNPAYVDLLEKRGLCFSGMHIRGDGTKLMEFVELPREQHPFFVATQAHPEFKSRLGNPNPLFLGFMHACLMKDQQLPILKHTDRVVMNNR